MSVSADSVKVATDQVRERDRSDGFKRRVVVFGRGGGGGGKRGRQMP